MKVKIKKSGCFWIVLFPSAIYGWAYNRTHTTFTEAVQYVPEVFRYVNAMKKLYKEYP